MNIRYYFAVCAIILSFSSVVKASEHTIFVREVPVIIVPSIFATKINVFFDKQVNSLLHKVIIPTHQGDHNVFWKTMTSIFEKIKHVYANLGYYLYNSLFSIFNW